MGRYGVGLIAVLAVLIVPWTAMAQGVPLLPGMNSFDLGSIRVSPWVRAGYQQVGVNVNLPVIHDGLAQALHISSSMDLQLLDAGMWIGGVGLEARLNSVSLFLAAEANAARSARARTAGEPYFGGDFTVEWRGSNLEWWNIDAGGSVALNSDLAVLAGFKVEHLSMTLADPIDPFGELPSNEVVYGDRYNADVRTKFWAPYVGMEISGPSYRGTLIFGPYVWADVRIPFSYTWVDDPMYYNNSDYKLRRGGIFLEGTFDYSVMASPGFGCSLWVKGSWRRIRGGGNEEFAQVTVPALFDLSQSESATGTYSCYILGGGVSFELNF